MQDQELNQKGRLDHWEIQSWRMICAAFTTKSLSRCCKLDKGLRQPQPLADQTLNLVVRYKFQTLALAPLTQKFQDKAKTASPSQ